MLKGALKILILEDNAADAEIIQRFLKKNDHSFNCKVAMNSQEYVKALDEFIPDVILSDNTLPQFSASEALAIAKERKLLVPFILVTGTVSEEFAAGIIKAGADDYLIKDRLTRLPAAIEAALKQKQTEKEKAHALQQLTQSEKRFRALVENNEGIISLLDDNMETMFRSSSATRITGWSNGEFERTDTKEYIHPDDIENVKSIIAKAKANPGKPFAVTMRVKHFNGHYIWLEGTVNNMSHDPSVGGVITNLRDVTARKDAEAARKESDEQYRILVEQASDGIFIADESGKFIMVNTSGCRMSGYTQAELKTKTIYDMVHPESLAAKPFNFAEMHKPKGASSQRKLLCKDGSVIDVEISAKFLSDKRFIAFIRDISERIKAEAEIIKEKNLSDSIINSLPGIFYLYNKDGVFLRWNKNFEKVTLYSGKEIKKMHPIQLFPEDEQALLIEKISNVFIAGEDNVQANLLLKSKAKIPYYFTGIAIDYEGSTCLMGVGIDFSERVTAQEKIKETSEQLRQLAIYLQSIREEERKRIGREIHDELGQQLTAIKMDVSWIDKKTAEDNAMIKNKLKNIITLLDGSNQSIRRILSELRPGILDDYGLIEAIEWLNRQFTANTSIPVNFTTTETELKLPEPLATCIFRVYQEAFTNITKYAGATKVTTSLTIANDIIKVVVKDNGNGFDKEAVKSKKSFGILGMRERVMALEGKFDLSSAPGKGTKMTFELPYKTKTINLVK